MNPDQEIKLQFSYKLSDWAKATVFYNSWHFSGPGDLFLLPALGLGVYELWLSFSLWPYYGLASTFWQGVFWLAVVLILKLDLLSLLSLWFRDLKRGGGSRRIYEFIFNNQGASYRYADETGREDVTQAWSQFRKIIESRNAFFIVYKSGGYWILPKQYFANPNEINSFRDLVRSKVGKQN